MCKIKLQGYPFRCDIETFWRDRCIKNKYHVFARLNENLDARQGCAAICDEVMPKSEISKIDGKTRPTWVLGKTLIFGKNYLPKVFTTWHQSKVIKIVQQVVRYYTFAPRLKNAMFSASLIGSRWKRILLERKAHAASNLVKKSWRAFHNWTRWADTCRRMERFDDVQRSTKRVQIAYRQFRVRKLYAEIYRQVVSRNASIYLRRIQNAVCNMVTRRLAIVATGSKLRSSLRKLRVATRVQAHVRSCLALRGLRRGQLVLQAHQDASKTAHAVWRMTREVRKVRLRIIYAIRIQTCWRRNLELRRYRRKRAIRAAAHAFARMVSKRAKFLAIQRSQIIVAQWYRWIKMRST